MSTLDEAKFKIDGQWYYRGNRSPLWLYQASRSDGSMCGIAEIVPSEVWSVLERVAQLEAEAERLREDAEAYRKLSTPEIHDFMLAVEREAAHQRERWGSEHDEGKDPEHWLWLVAHLATKAGQAIRYQDSEKYLHHIITCAAACCNWHANATKTNTLMRVGPPQENVNAT